jgi:serine/threonine protein kinase
MAEIFLARGASTAGMERYCVLKRILRNRASDAQFVRMFLDEARLAAQLNHPNVAQVYDIGKLGDSYFFTMEYVHGETVRALLQRARSLRRELPLGAVLTVIAGSASGLHHAHERLNFDGRPLGIVHRDVSPSNLMVSYEGGVKVVDFGVAKAADRLTETRSGTVKGKISYLSPEQCRGASVDRRTDLFALGIVMWEMLTGERLYRRASDFENMNAIVNEPPEPPSSRRRALPPEIDGIVMRLLAKDPDARYQTADELVDALEGAAASAGAMISSSGLGRLLREMFGQRPEPWLEIDAVAEAPEGVTVTSEPIPSELAVPVMDSVDLHLSEVPDLSEVAPHHGHPGDGVPRGASSGSSSSPHSLTRPGTRSAAGSHVATLSKSDLPPPLPPPPPAPPVSASTTVPVPSGDLPLAAPPPTQPEVPPHRTHPVTPRPSGPSISGGPRPSGPAIVPGSGAQAAILSGSGPQAAILPGSGGHALVAGGQALPPMEDPAAEEKPARSWPMIAVIGAAAVIGSLTVWIVMKAGGGGGADGAAADAPGAAVAALADAGAADEPAPRGSSGVTVSPVPELADAAVALVIEVDAAVAPSPAVDAAVAPIVPVAPSRTPLDIAMEDKRYDEAVTICTKRITAEIAASCALAACFERSEAKARQWFAKVPAGARPRVIATCRGTGIDLAPAARPRPPGRVDAGIEDKCEVDPMACQH